MIRCLSVLSMVAVLSACASTEMQSTLDSFKDLGQSLREGPATLVQDRPSGTALAATPLLGVLNQNPSSSSEAPEWPKVVITDLRFPANQLELGRSLSLKPNECITFGAVLWKNANSSERFSDLRLCADDLPRQSNDFVLVWKTFSIPGKTTGQLRTDGPTPPYSKLPSDIVLDRWIMNQFGLYYIGSLLTLVGFDPNFSVDERRFWVKNIASR